MSGVVASLYRLVTSQNPEFLPPTKSVPAVLVTVLLSMFTGPFIIALKIWNGMAKREMQVPLVALLLAICSVWSFYSGFVVLYFTYVVV